MNYKVTRKELMITFLKNIIKFIFVGMKDQCTYTWRCLFEENVFKFLLNLIFFISYIILWPVWIIAIGIRCLTVKDDYQMFQCYHILKSVDNFDRSQKNKQFLNL